MTNYIGQDFPNYQEQWPGPEAGLGMLPSRKSQRTRLNLRAPLPLNNQVFPQQHLYNYRDDPSGAGPGGQDPHLPEQPRVSRLALFAKLLATLPNRYASRLPVGPWSLINNTNNIMQERMVSGVETE